MSVVYRQKRMGNLSTLEQSKKILKDLEYEQAHAKLTTQFNNHEITKQEFDTEHDKQWSNYQDWAIANGLYEEITLQQQLSEVVDALSNSVTQVNEIRKELGMKTIKVSEV